MSHIGTIDARPVFHKNYRVCERGSINFQKPRKQRLTERAYLTHPVAHPGSPGLGELKAAGSPRLTPIGGSRGAEVAPNVNLMVWHPLVVQ